MDPANVSNPSRPPFPRAIGQPATRALTLAGYTDFTQLSGVPESELLALHGVGPKAIRVIRDALLDHGCPPMNDPAD